MKLATSCLALILPFSLVWACGSTSGTDDGAGATGGTTGGGTKGSFAGAAVGLGGDNTGPTTGGTTTNTGGTNVGTGGTLATELCGSDGCACSNGIDDDEDGRIDALDQECTGPLDNDEASFATGISGDNRDPKWQDCFFDGNSGAGEDRCRYATGCLTGELEQSDPDCVLSKACIDYCGARTPNGCDCFGCCTVTLDDATSVDILTGSACSLDTIGDADACPPCVKAAECVNNCGTCELCLGKTVADLPAECAPSGAGGAGGVGNDGPGYTCDGGEQVCGPGLDACAIDRYCSLGCCLLTPPK